MTNLHRRWRELAAVALGLALVAGCGTEDSVTAPDIRQAPADLAVGEVLEPECVTSQDCAGTQGTLGPCEIEVCLPEVGQCATQFVNDSTPCEDGDQCTLGDVCLAGVCQAGAPMACDSGSQCSNVTCDPQEGCVEAFASGECDDGNPCTVGDQCEEGGCTSGANECTCETDEDCEQYEDGNLCNGTLYCDSSGPLLACEVASETIPDCEFKSPDPCITGNCDPESGECGEVPAMDGIACDDGDACTYGDSCQAGACLAAETFDCDDGNPCTDDSCDPGTGCAHQESEACAQCSGLDCLACSFGSNCAPEGPYIADTCCSEGDPLIYLASGVGSEAVDIETDGTFVALCGGFGVRVSDVSNPSGPVFKDSGAPRCQRMEFGPVLEDGDRVLYVAHHGDSWVSTPTLWTFHLSPTGALTMKYQETEANVLYEGMEYAFGKLYVAAHGAGVRVYDVDPQGRPADLTTTVSGFENAWKLTVEGDFAWVADAEGGVKVLDLANPAMPVLVGTVITPAFARDVEVHEGRMYVAMGGDGVAVYDVSAPPQAVQVGVIEAQGSAQGVSAANGELAVAMWSHIAIYDAVNLQLLATERVRKFPAFDQVLGVAKAGDVVFAAEWEGLHVVQFREGYVAPDIYVEEELLSFSASEESAVAVIVENRGLLPLEVSNIGTDTPQYFTVDKTAMSIAPGEADVVEVQFAPPDSGSVSAKMEINSNDPDSSQNPYKLLLQSGDSNKINVGDKLNGTFSFLDPTGENQLSNLEGHVIVLAYFALF